MDGVDGGGVLRWGVEVAVEVAGELRRLAVTLQETERGGVTEVRKDVWKGMEEAGVLGTHGVRRKTENTAADCGTPVRNGDGLGACWRDRKSVV